MFGDDLNKNDARSEILDRLDARVTAMVRVLEAEFQATPTEIVGSVVTRLVERDPVQMANDLADLADLFSSFFGAVTPRKPKRRLVR